MHWRLASCIVRCATMLNWNGWRCSRLAMTECWRAPMASYSWMRSSVALSRFLWTTVYVSSSSSSMSQVDKVINNHRTFNKPWLGSQQFVVQFDIAFRSHIVQAPLSSWTDPSFLNHGCRVLVLIALCLRVMGQFRRRAKWDGHGVMHSYRVREEFNADSSEIASGSATKVPILRRRHAVEEGRQIGHWVAFWLFWTNWQYIAYEKNGHSPMYRCHVEPQAQQRYRLSQSKSSQPLHLWVPDFWDCQWPDSQSGTETSCPNFLHKSVFFSGVAQAFTDAKIKYR